ncbi:MAG: DUF11 domain-containing protein, partial [Bacteroidetes bacterium]|nr:DUF11 domain-containing protein [Bacteroidota bacterium]
MKSIYLITGKNLIEDKLISLDKIQKTFMSAFLLVSVLFSLLPSLNAQTVTTDKVDYLPNDVVTASGKGWEAFETVELLLKETELLDPAWEDITTTVTCDALGKFSEEIYTVVNADLGAFFQLKATGQTSQHVATITFNDAGGDYGIDFSAYDPEFYERQVYYDYIAGNTLPTGREVSPLANGSYSTSHSSTRESLMPEYLGLGQIVAFEYFVRVDASAACTSDVIQIKGEWLTETTNGGLFGFDGDLGVIAAFVDESSGDALIDPNGDASVSDLAWTLNGAIIESSIEVSGMDPGDEIIVEVWLVLQQSIPAGVGGNVKTRLGDAATIGGCEEGKINTGNQEVPLLQVGDFFTADVDLDITKTDDPDPVGLGSQYSYTITVTNEGPSVANTVVVTDILDVNTAYVSHSITDIVGATTWTFSQSGQTLTFETPFLNVGESVDIIITVQVNDVDGYTSTTSGIAYENGGYGIACTDGDLCNLVGVTTQSDDIDPTNDNYYEPTGVLCPVIIVTAEPTNETCNESDDGSITGTVSGGFINYSVVIFGINGTILPTGYVDTQTVTTEGGTYTFSDLWAGDYQIDVTDAKGCTATTTTTITQPATLTATITAYTNVDCFGNNTGSATVTANGGTPPYTYLWDDPVAQTTQTATDLAAGTYIVTVTDAHECTTSATVTLIQPQFELTATVEVTSNVDCYGDATGACNLVVTGGTETYTYFWTASEGGVIPTGQEDDQYLSGLVAGKYTVVVTDANLCEATDFVIITQPDFPITVTELIASHLDVTCFGYSDGSLTVTASGGIEPYSYSLDNIDFSNTTGVFSGLAAGDYTIYVKDANECNIVTPLVVTISEPAPLAASITAQTNVDCFGNS